MQEKEYNEINVIFEKNYQTDFIENEKLMSFYTVINCMDGRTQLSENEFLRNKFGVDYVDTIT